MDAFSDPAVKQVVVMSSSQIGKSQILLNVAGRFIDIDPSSIMLIQPTDKNAEDFSRDRFSSMVRDTPCLKDKVADVKAKNSSNTLLHKNFSGGYITMSGANSPSNLASKPIRVLLLDEVDRYPDSAGTEGDPVKLAMQRTKAFFNSIVGLFSTPGVKGNSRIEKAFENSDKRFYHVPCPACGEYQKLYWRQVKFENRDPETAYYECGHCRAKLNDSDINNAVKRGKWIAEGEFNGVAGFHLNALYSPWEKAELSAIVKEFFEAKNDVEQLKTWVNTTLGETWEEEGETVDETSIIKRVEVYPAEVPRGGIVITAGCDVQANRIEAEAVAWGKNNENWSVEYRVFYGDTSQKNGRVWQDLDDWLQKDFRHENGVALNISAACVDSGHNTVEVYDFCKERFKRRIYPIKGQGGNGVPIIGRASKIKYGKPARSVYLFPIGVDQAKITVFSMLQKKEIGAGYCHFPNFYNPEYFDMLTAEKAVTKFVKGFRRIEWKKIRERNEALDCRVYALAAFKLLNPNIEKIAERLGVNNSIKSRLEIMRQRILGLAAAEIAQKQVTKPRKQGGFVRRYR